ncbi:MAG: glycosyl hydrolase family 57 [Leptolyngbyaceae bacterium]|nr:glycosyl hydrolase family 57 [Leptolyngbyaceae bacterium]
MVSLSSSTVSTAPSPVQSPTLPQLPDLPSLVDGLPHISGWETEVEAVTGLSRPVALPYTNLKLRQVSAAFAIALHMHQPTIPAGPNGELINNLQYMFEHPCEQDNHNAGSFAYCYGRMADFIRDLVDQGCNPRIMLDYSGNLLWGLDQMGRQDILDNLRRITCDAAYYPHVEWLGTMWGHAVIPSTPMQDIRLHVQAWQHHFASLFGWEALARVKGFSLPEMHLPNHPDQLYGLITILKNCGYRWLLVQADSIESMTGDPIAYPHIPHRLVARNAHGETAAITVLIKTQGSDGKLVGQMQPYYAAKHEAEWLTTEHGQQQAPCVIAGKEIPPLITQVSDGENGGVMMNEFPGAFRNAWYEIREQGLSSGVMGLNGSEYLELLEAEGIEPADYPQCQAKGQHLIWQHVDPDRVTPQTMDEAIATLTTELPDFRLAGNSWTNYINWEHGYDNVLSAMQTLSQQFHTQLNQTRSQHQAIPLTQQHRYRNALVHHLLLQTSCFRYWGQGTWTDYAQEIYQRGEAILRYDFRD